MQAPSDAADLEATLRRRFVVRWFGSQRTGYIVELEDRKTFRRCQGYGQSGIDALTQALAAHRNA